MAEHMIEDYRNIYGLVFDRSRALTPITQPEQWRVIYTATPTEEFWRAWRADKAALKAAGFEPRKSGHKWVVEYTEMVKSGGGRGISSYKNKHEII